MMRAVAVNPEAIPKAWPLIERWVGEALVEGKADLAPAAVLAQLQRGHMQLWLAWEGKRALGCCVTELNESVRGRYCNLVAVAGLDFAKWRPLIEIIKAWAREHGCVRLQAGGREGWVRAVKADGWSRTRTVIEMEL